MNTKNSDDSVGSRIRQTRKFLKFTQAELSENIGISGSHLSDIERGKMLPTLPTLQKISSALSRPIEYFIADEIEHRTLNMVIPRSLIGKQALLRLAEVIAVKTNGELKIQFFQHAIPNAVYKQIEGLAEGSIHILLDDLLSFEHYASLCGVAFLPYFFRTRDDYLQFLASDLFHQQINTRLLANGIRILNPKTGWEYSQFELLFSNTPIFSPDDMAGKRMRSYASKPANLLREQLQTVPVQVLWGNGREAFEDDQIDMFLIPAAYATSLQLHHAASYATVIDYGYTQNLVCAINEHIFQTLPPDMQHILVTELDNIGGYFAEIVQQQTDASVTRLSSEYQLPVIHPDPRTWRARFSTAIHNVCQQPDILQPHIYAELRHCMIESETA